MKKVRKDIVLPKIVTLGGKKYKFRWKRMKHCQGLCSDPSSNAEDRIIHINPDGPWEEVAKVCIHEATHAQLWFLDEDTVERVSSEMFDMLVAAKIIVPPA